MDIIESSHDHNEEKKPRNKVIWVAWNILFACFYPVLAVFSLVIMIVMFISSTLSKVIFWIAGLFNKQK